MYEYLQSWQMTLKVILGYSLHKAFNLLIAIKAMSLASILHHSAIDGTNNAIIATQNLR